MFRRAFYLIKRLRFMIQIHDFLKSLTKTNIPFFWFENDRAQLFMKKGMSVWRINSDCPNQPALADLPRQLKTHIAFSMFPILDTNLCLQSTRFKTILEF